MYDFKGQENLKDVSATCIGNPLYGYHELILCDGKWVSSYVLIRWQVSYDRKKTEKTEKLILVYKF